MRQRRGAFTSLHAWLLRVLGLYVAHSLVVGLLGSVSAAQIPSQLLDLLLELRVNLLQDLI